VRSFASIDDFLVFSHERMDDIFCSALKCNVLPRSVSELAAVLIVAAGAGVTSAPKQIQLELK
jgi:hypothetical protein